MKKAGWVLIVVSLGVILLQTIIISNILNDITAMATDGSVSVTINDLNVDTTVPAVVIQAPADGSLFSENDSIAVQAQVTDANTIDSVIANITLPNASTSQLTLTDGDNDSVFTGTFTVTFLNGTYTLQIIATDNSDNINNSISVQFIVQDFVPAPPPAQPVVSAGGGGATRRFEQRAPVQPTVDIPPPPVFRRTVTPYRDAPTVAPETLLQKVLQLPKQAVIMLKELPAIMIDKGKAVSAIMLFTAINMAIAFMLISYATMRMLSLLRGK